MAEKVNKTYRYSYEEKMKIVDVGHSNVSTTLNIYTHTSKLQEKRVTRTLNLLRLFKTF